MAPYYYRRASCSRRFFVRPGAVRAAVPVGAGDLVRFTGNCRALPTAGDSRADPGYTGRMQPLHALMPLPPDGAGTGRDESLPEPFDGFAETTSGQTPSAASSR
jgi:hypothetical protein